jgi:hypothetical protein
VWGYNEEVLSGDILTQSESQDSISRVHFHHPLDVIGQYIEPPVQVLLCSLLEKRSRTEEDGIKCKLAGLALAPGEIQDTWRRIGMWKLVSDVKDISVWTLPGGKSIFNLPEGSETKNITLV